MRKNTHLILPVLFAIALAWLLQHFLGSIAWAGLLAVITWPLHARLMRRGWTPLASASFMLALLIVSFVGPSILLFHTLTYELSSLQRLLVNFNQTGVPVPAWLSSLPFVADTAVKWWMEHLAVPGGLNALVRTTVGDFMPHLTDTARVWGSTILANALYLFLTMLTLFVLYLHGDAVMHYLDRAGARLLPEQYGKLRRVLPLSVRGTALGLGSIAILEGIVLGVAYWVAGAPAPVLLGVITGYLALIPGGAPLSFTMVSLLLFGQGHSAEALGLFTWGAVELFLVDKFIRPKLIGKRVNLPFLAVLFGLLGGVSTMGVIGLFVGPLMMAILFGWLRDGQPESPASPVPATVQTVEEEKASNGG